MDWRYQELSPPVLIKTLHLEEGAISGDELKRAEWFWEKRPTALSESLICCFTYLMVLVFLLYLLPFTAAWLLLWLVAGATHVFADQSRLNRWRREYERSISRMTIHLLNEKKGGQQGES